MQTMYGRLFLCTLVGYTILFIIYLIYAKYTLNHSQTEIKECYVEHIHKADSLYFNLAEYNRNIMVGFQKVNDAVITDSLLKVTLTNAHALSKGQYEKLILLIHNHFNEIELLHNKYDEKLLSDSLRLSTERGLLEGQTKTMIDLHLNKVEHEYSNITMWGAILTILFLVFSFYSIYKMDELIQQGNEGVKEIKRVKREGERVVEKLEIEGNALIENTKTKVNTIVVRQQRRMAESINMLEQKRNEIETQYGESLRGLSLAKENFDTQGLKILADLTAQIDDMLKEKEDVLNSKQREFDRLLIEAASLYEQIKARKNVIEEDQVQSSCGEVAK